MADITEIIEESAVQLEIVESGGGQVEIVDGNSTIIEIVETTLDSKDLDIATQINTVVVESPADNTIVNISSEETSIIETTITNNVVEIMEHGVAFISQSITKIGSSEDWDGHFVGDARITGSLTISSSNTLTNIGPFVNVGNLETRGQYVNFFSNVTASGNIGSTGKITAAGLVAGEDIIGRTSIKSDGNLTVSDTIFTDVLSASIAQFTGDGANNILIIKSGSSFPITVNHEGLIIFDEFTYTPTPVLGGLLYSGSDFYFGLEC
tara:strand:+ start:1183 stop:1980 length:798 start_codon:yes stop_codon:yes gene_type:complete